MAEEPRLALDESAPWWASPPVTADSTLAVAASAYLEHLARSGATANTISAFAADLRLFCSAAGSGQPVGALTRAQVEAFCQELQQDEGTRSSARSLRRRLTTLRALFRYLAELGAVDAALCQPVARPREQAQAQPPLSEQETARLTEAGRQLMAEGEPRALLLLLLTLDCGLTKSQCLALRHEDLDLAADTITLHRSTRSTVAVPPAAAPGANRADQGESSDQRTVPLPPELKQAFLGLRDSAPSEGPLFRCTGRALEYVLARAGQRAGLERNPSFRLLRATAAAHMLARGEPPAAVVAALGISPATWPAVRRRLRSDAPLQTPPLHEPSKPEEPTAPAES